MALRGLRDPGAAQDVVQETFLRAWRSADRDDPDLASLRLPAGEFLGVPRLMGCDLQAALLREDTAGFLVLDGQGRTVASTSLPARPAVR